MGKLFWTKEEKEKHSKLLKGRHLSPFSEFKKGHRMSEKTKRKMSLSRIGEKNPFFGKTHTKEIIEKIVKAHKGKPSKRWKGGYENKLWHNRQRRVKKLGNGGFYTQGEWEILKVQYGLKCPSCDKVEPIIKLTVDHIIPLSKDGSNNIENIQPLCKSCNCRKHDKIIKYLIK